MRHWQRSRDSSRDRGHATGTNAALGCGRGRRCGCGRGRGCSRGRGTAAMRLLLPMLRSDGSRDSSRAGSCDSSRDGSHGLRRPPAHPDGVTPLAPKPTLRRGSSRASGTPVSAGPGMRLGGEPTAMAHGPRPRSSRSPRVHRPPSMGQRPFPTARAPAHGPCPGSLPSIQPMVHAPWSTVHPSPLTVHDPAPCARHPAPIPHGRSALQRWHPRTADQPPRPIVISAVYRCPTIAACCDRQRPAVTDSGRRRRPPSSS
jgi:hypothetical protein